MTTNEKWVKLGKVVVLSAINGNSPPPAGVADDMVAELKADGLIETPTGRPELTARGREMMKEIISAFGGDRG
jgi:hypothetical protein